METKASREWATDRMLADLEEGIAEAFAAQQRVIAEFISLATILQELEGAKMTGAQRRKYRALQQKLGGDTLRKGNSSESPPTNRA
jgi:hypothetical protein